MSTNINVYKHCVAFISPKRKHCVHLELFTYDIENKYYLHMAVVVLMGYIRYLLFECFPYPAHLPRLIVCVLSN